MKKSILFIFTIVSTMVVNGQKFSYHRDYDSILKLTKNPASKVFYKTLLKRFNANDSTRKSSEVLALMIGYTAQPNYQPYSYLFTERAIYDLNGAGKFKEAIAACDTFITSHPLSQQAIIEKSYAFFKIGKQDSADFYMERFRKIMEAMDYSGDGLTPETAIFAVGPADGQNYIRKYLSSGIGSMGDGTDKYGNFCDILERKSEKDESAKSIRMYFQIQPASKTMMEELEKVNEK